MKARYQYRFYPTDQQQEGLARLFGCVRVVWNDALAICKQSVSVQPFGHENSEARPLGLAGERTRSTKKPKSAELQKRVITQAKKTSERAWLSEVSNIPLQQSVADLETAFKNFFDSCKGKRKGRRVGYPKFKKRTSSQSARLTRGGFSLKNQGVYLAKIGIVKPIWSRELPSEPSSVTIIKDCANRYFLSFVVEIQPVQVNAKNQSVGIDLGIKTFAVLSNGVIAVSPSYKTLDRKVRKLQRKLSRQQNGSNRRNKTRVQIAKRHNQIADTRKDFLHKLSTKVVSDNQAIVLEDLNVSGMVKNRKLSRTISQQGWRNFRVLVESKSEKYERNFVVINRWEPTSQVCSNCGFKWGKIDLSVRSVFCLSCGTEHDRDENASVNIEKVGIGHCHDSKRTQRQSKTTSVASVDEASRITVSKRAVSMSTNYLHNSMGVRLGIYSMQPIRTFNVSPSLPKPLEPLRKLAYNLHWDWNFETKDLFKRLDRDLWESSRHNPVLMLGTISQTRLTEIAEDEGFLAQMERASRQLDNYLVERTWYRKHRPLSKSSSEQPQTKECFAYFCAEFGLVDCLPIYSGGLGVLAGDHLKSASDLGLPLVAVGLLYQEGYFAQYLNADGWQQERYPINDFYNMPLHLERKQDGSELRIEVDYPGRTVYARVWRVQVGIVPLYLLDTNIEPNNPYDHDITDQLYGGDLDMRIHQEMMLGIGGVRALQALGYEPTVYHLNEGHSAFLILERIRKLIEEKHLSFAEAKQVAQATQVFTTHTPVSAGFDLFPPDKALYYVGHYAKIFGLPPDEFLSLGREDISKLDSPFSMAALAIKTSSFINGVSQLHGEVSRVMFHGLWRDLPLVEVPITAITNGVHARSVVHKSKQELYDSYGGTSWSEKGSDDPLWERMSSIPDEELWRIHERCRSEMVLYVRERSAKHLRDRGATPIELASIQEILDPKALTIGFARRFATYKRANLFMRDMNRIKQIMMANKERRVQFVIAGKAHPKDIPGKDLIREIIHQIREAGIGDYVVFIPNYDIHLARHLVSGCDVWLNTPRRPREASGTSGMKASMNGLPNLSILDGWWDEADYVRTGWAIGHGETYDDAVYEDRVEANALYDLLEQEVVPLFYNRDADGVPKGWVAKMKAAIKLNTPYFNTARMLRDYAMRGYFPTSDRSMAMTSNNYQPAKNLASWKRQLFEHWFEIKIVNIDIAAPDTLMVNQVVAVKARINLAGLTPNDIEVQLYQGAVNEKGEIVDAITVAMEYQGVDESRCSVYKANIMYSSSGLQGLSLRVLPKHDNLSSPYEPGLVLWA